jgi:hypothetical protein
MSGPYSWFTPFIYISEVLMKISTFFRNLLWVLVLCAFSMYAQTPQFSVAKKAGSTGLDRPHAIAVNGDGDVYIGAEFTAKVDFGNGDTLTSAGNVDFVVVKYDSMGNTKWARRGGGTLTDRCYGVDVDNDGNVYITGEYYGTADFGPYTVTSSGNLDFIIAKLDSAGNYLWLKEGRGFGNTLDATRDLVVDNNGNVIITGHFGGTNGQTITFDSITLTTNGLRDIVVAKYNTDGEIQWAKNFGGKESGEEGRSITVDENGNIFVTGIFSDTAQFGNIELISNGGWDVFFLKLDPSGNVIWVKSGGSDKNDDGSGIAVDYLGNIYACGKYDSAAVFGVFSIMPNAGLDPFVVKISPTGEFLWLQNAGGDGNDYATDITVDKSGNPYVLGYFPGTAVIGGESLTSLGNDDNFVWGLTSDGTTTFVKQFGGSDLDKGYAITNDYGGNLYVTCAFRAVTNLDGFQFTFAGNDDIVYGRIGSNPVPVELTSFNASVNGKDVVLSWETATEVNNSGFQVERSTDKVSFTSVGFVKGNGSTSEKSRYSFVDTDLKPGAYYYRLKQMDLDGKFEYSKVVEVNLEIPASYNLSQNYPNPFNPSTEISFSVPVDASVTLSVYNAVGEKVLETVNNFTPGTYKHTIDGKNLTSGIYFYSIKSAGSNGSVFSSTKKMVLIK